VHDVIRPLRLSNDHALTGLPDSTKVRFKEAIDHASHPSWRPYGSSAAFTRGFPDDSNALEIDKEPDTCRIVKVVFYIEISKEMHDLKAHQKLSVHSMLFFPGRSSGCR
jgi:hypothetical protein